MTANEALRDFVIDGLPSSGAHKPLKRELRELFTGYETSINNAFTSGSSVIFTSRSALYASLDYAATTLAWVVGDTTPAYNGIYQKSGASGSGSWTWRAPLPYSFIRAVDAGAGTPNAIVATSSIAVPTAPYAVLVVMSVFEANTGPVTLALNGNTPRSLKTASGADLASGYLAAGMLVTMVYDGTSFRLITDVVSAAIQAAAEEAQAGAELARDEAVAAVASLSPPMYATIATAEAARPVSAPAYVRTAHRNSSNNRGSGATYAPNGGASGDVTMTLNDETTKVGFDLNEPEYHFAQFGTVGAADDSTVWQTAIDEVSSLGGGVIRVPWGTTNLGHSVRNKPLVILRGYGRASIVQLADGAVADLATNGDMQHILYSNGHDDLGFENFVLDGNAANNTSAVLRGINVEGGEGHTLDRMMFKGIRGTALSILSASAVEVTRIRAKDVTGNYPGNNPGEVIYARDIVDSIIHGIRATDIDDHVIYIDGGSGSGTDGVEIGGAVARNAGRVSQSSAYNVFQNSKKVTFNNCHSYGSGLGFTCISNGAGTLFPQDIEWNGCTALNSDGTSESHGWSIAGVSARVLGRYRLNNCKAYGNGVGAVVVGSGFRVDGIDDIEFNECTASNNNDNGFDLTNCTNFKINGRALNNSRRSTGAFDGVRLGDGTTGADCSSGSVNVIAKDTASSGKKQAYGVYARGTSSDIEIRGKLDGNASGAFLKDSGVTTTSYVEHPRGQVRTAFTLRIRNNAGTLQHAFGRVGTAFTSNSLMSAINSAATSATSTPTGTDGSTAFAGGGKVSSDVTNRFVLDTASQTTGEQDFTAIVAAQTAGTGLNVRATIESMDINGVTRNRLCFEFVDNVGNAFAINTTNLADGEVIDVTFSGYLAI